MESNNNKLKLLEKQLDMYEDEYFISLSCVMGSEELIYNEKKKLKQYKSKMEAAYFKMHLYSTMIWKLQKENHEQ